MGVALLRPVAVLSVPANRTTILLTLDVSGSMCANDIDPTRLRAAQDAASAFVSGIPDGTQIGIVAFSSLAAIIQQPTDRQDDLLASIESLTTGRGTAIGSGILTAIDAIAALDANVAPADIDGRPGLPPAAVLPGAYSPAIIVVLTDGANNAGIDPIDAATQAADRGLRVYTIGFGTVDGGQIDPVCRQRLIGNEPGQGGGNGFGNGGFGFGGGGFRRGIDEDTLTAVAKMTGGTYSPAESAAQLQQVFEDLPTTTITRAETVELTVGFVALGVALVGVGAPAREGVATAAVAAAPLVARSPRCRRSRRGRSRARGHRARRRRAGPASSTGSRCCCPSTGRSRPASRPCV